jgi:acyl dehydratase
MCTMALCARSVVDELAGGDPARLRRLAVRFYRPVFPGNDLVTSVFEAGTQDGRRILAFEASSAGKVVIRDGRAELGPSGPSSGMAS